MTQRPEAPHIERVIDLATIKRQLSTQRHAGAVYYSDKSCWWSHQRGHAYRAPKPGEMAVMMCPLGGAIFMERNWEGWFEAAEDNPAHYGYRGLDAFVAAHHQNCRNAQTGGAFASPSWVPYNAGVDALLEEEKGRG